MRRVAAAAWALAGAFAGLLGPAEAGAELLLLDGRTVAGTDVRRQGSNYQLVQDDGQILTIPVELVRELRLLEEGPPAPLPAPTAWRTAEPEVLAGPPQRIEPPRMEDQAAALGPPARFQAGVFDPVWIPSSDWTLDPAQNDFNPTRWFTAPIEALWTPLSAFDGRIDVLAHSRAAWIASPIDSTWWPTETTWLTPKKSEPQPPAPMIGSEYEAQGEIDAGAPVEAPSEDVEPAAELAQFTPAGRAPAKEGRVEPEVCAREIFRPLTSRGERDRAANLRVEPVVDASLTDLAVDLFRGRIELDGRAYTALFTTGGGVCRLIGGDLDSLLGMALGESGQIDHSLRSYEQTLGDRPAPTLSTAAEKIAYAQSLSLLADPSTSQGAEHAPTLLETRADLERLGEAPAGGCPLTAKKRAVELARALADFAPPTVVATDVGDIVTLSMWSADGGRVTLHTIRLEGAGKTSIERRVVAGHIGAHQDAKPRK